MALASTLILVMDVSRYECENTGSRLDEIEDPATILIRWQDWLASWENACRNPVTAVVISDDEETYE